MSGVWSLQSLRSLETGVTPESEVWSLESLWVLESGVWSHSETGVRRHSGVGSL